MIFNFKVHSQVVIEEEITTDTIEIFSAALRDSDYEKKGRIAMWSTILLPGLGHQFLHKDSKALIYFAVEATAIIGMIFNEKYSQKLYSDSRSFAWHYANTNSQKPAAHSYWQLIGDKYFLNYKHYNNAVELNGEYNLKKTDPNEFWEWESDSYQTKYRGIREDAIRFHVISSFFLGAMFLNRIVSFIDIRVSSKYHSVQNESKNIQFHPTYSSVQNEIGISLTGNF